MSSPGQSELDQRDKLLLQALLDIAVEIRAFRGLLYGIIAPELRNEAGMKMREGFLRTEEMKSGFSK